MHVHEVLDDLIAEQQALDAVVAALPPEDWRRPTPSPGWTVADQIGHLTFFDTTAALAIEDPDGFVAHRVELVERFTDAAAVDELTLGEFRALDPPEQLAAWREARARLARAGRTLDDDTRVEWYGPSMGSKSFLTARLMEVWAHGQDVCDTVGAHRPATDRLRHVAQLGVITRNWSYLVRGEVPPEGDVHVELTAPSGDHWCWGAEDAAASVTGPAEDFCLVVTQRRHVDDTHLTVSGGLAQDWMTKAQAFAGGPTDGPPVGGQPSRGAG
jgi:uncharacterized protein (TIGR03084 family)